MNNFRNSVHVDHNKSVLTKKKSRTISKRQTGKGAINIQDVDSEDRQVK